MGSGGPAVVAAAQAALVLAQGVLAGRFLTGDGDALGLHERLGTEVLTLVAAVSFVLAVLVWRPGRGPGWPALAALIGGLAIPFQIVFGFERRLELHVPLAIAIFGLYLSVALVARARSRTQAGRRPTLST